MDNARLQPWTAVKQGIVKDNGHATSGFADGSNEETVSPMASQHRDLILQAATRLADAYSRKPGVKRASSADNCSANKRPRSSSNPKQEPTISKTRLSKGTQPLGQSYKSEPVKRYLLPTKANKLNKRPKLAPATKIKSHESDQKQMLNCREVTTGLVAYIEQENRPDLVNANSMGESHITKTQGLENLSQSSKTPSGAIHTGSSADIDMDWDVDDTFFDSSEFDDEKTLTVMDTENLLPTSLDLAAASDEHRSKNTEKNIPSHLAEYSSRLSPHGAIQIQPFLRQTYFEPISETMYSAVPRLIPTLQITTCFRIADARRVLKGGGESQKMRSGATIELYAWLNACSSNSDGTQTLHFADLFFPDRPPYLVGTGRGLGQLINIVSDRRKRDSSSGKLEANNIICRAIVRHLDSTSHSRSATRTVLNNTVQPTSAYGTMQDVRVEAIRRSDWEELQYVRGIVDPQSMEVETKKK